MGAQYKVSVRFSDKLHTEDSDYLSESEAREGFNLAIDKAMDDASTITSVTIYGPDGEAVERYFRF